MQQYIRKSGLIHENRQVACINRHPFFIPTFLFKIAGYTGFLFEKLGLHIGFLTILGEFGYSFVASNDVKLNQREKHDTYENFENIIMKLFNSAEE